MKKETILNDLELYIGALNYIDSRTSLLEHAEADFLQQKKQLYKIEHQFKGFNIFIYWILFAGISLIPLSLLNLVIDTTFNFIYLVPVISLIMLLLYINKNSNTVQKKQISGMKKNVKVSENKLMEIIGEINYTKTLAEGLLHRLLAEKRDYDLLTCSPIILNLNALNYIYECINRGVSKNLNEAIEHFELTLEETKKDKFKIEIINNYNYENLKAEFRKGILKRCIKEQTKENSPIS